jgi:hypothetical protein
MGAGRLWSSNFSLSGFCLSNLAGQKPEFQPCGSDGPDAGHLMKARGYCAESFYRREHAKGPKAEIRNPNGWPLEHHIKFLMLGFRNFFGFRHSVFGFQESVSIRG